MTPALARGEDRTLPAEAVGRACEQAEEAFEKVCRIIAMYYMVCVFSKFGLSACLQGSEGAQARKARRRRK